MATDGLSGNYTYLELRAALKQQGIKSSNLNRALEQVADDNDIDNIKQLDGEEKVTVSASVFTNYAQETTNSSPDADLFSLNNQSILNGAIYNDDEWEVADYDDFYNFGGMAVNLNAQNAAAQNPDAYAQAHAQQNGITFEEAKEKLQAAYGDPNAPYTNNSTLQENEIDFEQFESLYKNEFKNSDGTKQAFENLDADLNGYLSEAELASLYGISNPIQEKQDDRVNTTTTGREDLMGGGMMEMDMSNDSFNPQ